MVIAWPKADQADVLYGALSPSRRLQHLCCISQNALTIRYRKGDAVMTMRKRKPAQFNVRFAAELFDEVKKAAKQNRNSLTAEIAMRVGKSFGEEKLWGAARHAIFTWASTYVWAGEQAAKTNNIKISQWITDRGCLGEAWVAATRASLDAVAPTPQDRRQLIDHFLALETPVIVKWDGDK
jgi:hypothetical protein